MPSSLDTVPKIPDRERQALREVGRTTVRFRTALAATLLFLVLVAVVPAIQLIVGPTPAAAVGDLARAFSEVWSVRGSDGWLAGNRRALAALDRFETRLEDESVLRARLLPPVQALLTSLLGAGNEQVYVGRGGWLFYRPDVDFVTAPAFDDPAVVKRRRRGGEAWEAPPEPDPLPAILALDRDLARRGIELLVMPTPVKPSILPAGLVWRRTEPPPLTNPGLERLVGGLEAEGVEVLDVASWMAAIPVEREAQFLTTDTHWTPRAMDAAAKRLAESAARFLPPAGSGEMRLSRRELVVDGRGDIEAMLRLPQGSGLFAPQRVSVSMVTTGDGRGWASDPGAQVLLLGDSFTNVFSDASLGWGQGAGLAEQLSYHLSRPVDRIARNAGGSNAARRALVDALLADPDRLSSKIVVIYQFATRELAFGDWPVLPLPD